MPRNSEMTKARIIKMAGQLFYANGIRAVSVDDIAEQAGVTKRTIYYHFDSKDDLIAAYLVERDQPNLKAFQKWFDAADGNLADKIAAIFNGVARAASNPKWRGCGFLRTAGELANMPGHPAMKASARHKKRLETWLQSIFPVNDFDDPARLARQIVLLLDGSFSTMLVHRDAAYIHEAGRAATMLVAAHTRNSVATGAKTRALISHR